MALDESSVNSPPGLNSQAGSRIVLMGSVGYCALGGRYSAAKHLGALVVAGPRPAPDQLADWVIAQAGPQ